MQSRTFKAPARVNLLGEHTDYTGGLVLPMAIDFHTEATITPANDGAYHFTSTIFSSTRTLTRDDRSPAVDDWSDYPVGVLRELQKLGIELPPFTLHLTGNVPFAAGLSSSASVEVASCMAMLSLVDAPMTPAEIALLCQRAENLYVQSPCGIMDQFVIAAAHAGRALLLDTRTLHTEHLPLDRGTLAQTQMIVCNSMAEHSVASGEYGTRRRESEEGQAVLIDRFPALRDLGDATIEQLEACRHDMSEESFRRCRHIVTDNDRVRQARAALEAGNAQAFGALMLAGHASERDDFECSTEEIDFLVETAAQIPGCYGARLTGGGFGGCTVNLVERSYAQTFAETLKAAYHQRFGITAEIYICDAVDGAVALNARD